MNSVFRFAKVSKDVIEIAKGIVKNNGYTFVGMTRKSNLPNMSNYYIVVGQGGYKNGFCVWNFEDVRGIRKDEKGYLSSGVYDLTFAEMLAEVKERVIENYDSDDADVESESNVAKCKGEE